LTKKWGEDGKILKRLYETNKVTPASHRAQQIELGKKKGKLDS